MRKVVLFIAMSLDGYIADALGGVDWLRGHGEEEAADAYGRFLRDVDTIIMGWNTYRQVTTELSPDEWVYHGRTTYVITHRQVPDREEVRFVCEDPCRLVKTLRKEDGGVIWVCGGAAVIRALAERDLIDEYDISVIPTLLGGGLRLFGDLTEERRLRLVRTETGDGILEAVYERRRSDARAGGPE